MARKRFPGRFIWNTYGDWCASELDGNIWDLRGEWVGWVEENGDVYKKDGEWIGRLTKDNRIVKKRSDKRRDLRTDIPSPPPKPDLPARAPLPPSFSELNFSEIDVLDEDPRIWKKLSDLRPDME